MAELTKRQQSALTKKGATVRAPRSTTLDKESHAMMLDGCNLSQLCKVFAMDRRTLEDKIREVSPNGARGGYPIYLIREVAPYVVKPAYDIETYLRRMNHKDLPPMLSKEYWNGLKAKQDYQLKEGELWPTEDVIKTMSEMLKTLKMSWLLTRDSIERDTVLTKPQRDRMAQLMDAALEQAADSLQEKFGGMLNHETRQPIQDDEI